MNRSDAIIIAETITNEQIQEMFNNAKANVKDWAKVSTNNKGFTKGVAWNILAKDFNVEHNYHILAKTNMVNEFGDFLPVELKPKKHRKVQKKPVHQEPQF